MIWLLVPYFIIASIGVLYAWGFSTLDTKLSHISLKAAIISIVAGLFWPVTIVVIALWIVWESR
jgi:hypothetical protein